MTDIATDITIEATTATDSLIIGNDKGRREETRRPSLNLKIAPS
jgi:hypothetical protein